MNDLTYEFQRMVSRSTEIREATKAKGAQAAWEQYSLEHKLDKQRFGKGNELRELQGRFDGIGSGRGRQD
jgi:hypothetical protein